MRRIARTACATPPPPGTNATGTARIRMIAMFLTVRSTALILLSRHHDDADGYRCQRGGQGHQPQGTKRDGGDRPPVPAAVGEPGGAEDRQREDERQPDAGDEGCHDRLE